MANANISEACQGASGTGQKGSVRCTTLGIRLSKKRIFLEILILLISGGCMTLSFAPANISFFAWFCVIPLLWICAGKTVSRAFLYGLVWGYAWHVTGVFFLREISFIIPFIFAIILGLFNAVFAAFVPFFCRNLLYPMEVQKADFDVREKFYQYPAWAEILATLGLSTLWIALEWVRSWIFTGFPWNLLAASQYQNSSLIQICEYTGIYGVSFFVILMNVAGYFALHGLRFSLPEGKYKRPFPLIGAIVLLIVANSWGVSLFNDAQKRYQDHAFTYAVGVVQPHLSQRREGTASQSMEALNECADLTRRLIVNEPDDTSLAPASDGPVPVGENSVPAGDNSVAPRNSPSARVRSSMDGQYIRVSGTQLIVWPESAVPCPYYYYDPDFDARLNEWRANHVSEDFIHQHQPFSYLYRQTVRDLMKDARVPFLIGTLSYGGNDEIYNSALLLKNTAPVPGNFEYDLVDLYSKVHIVPFGEFVPLAWKFPVLDKWFGMGRSLTEGKAFRPLNVSPNVKAGTLICYEDVFPYTARAQAQNGAQFILVITNDAWYPTSSEPEQHYINALFRTVETRLPMVRVGNSNYSVLVNSLGQLENCISKRYLSDGSVEFFPERQVRGSEKFLVSVLKNPPKTFYTQYGDVFAVFCVFIALAVVISASVRAYLFSRAIDNDFERKRMKIREDFLKSEKRK